MPIVPHGNGELLLGALHIHIVYQFTMILLVIWSTNVDSSVLTSKASSNLLNDDIYQCICVGNYVIHLGK